jgi:prevent-host-death family protein
MIRKPRILPTVRVAEFKANLSAYLRAVQRGSHVTVFDRDTPIARVLPMEESSAMLPVRRALMDLRTLRLGPLPSGWGGVDSLAMLREERRDR